MKWTFKLPPHLHHHQHLHHHFHLQHQLMQMLKGLSSHLDAEAEAEAKARPDLLIIIDLVIHHLIVDAHDRNQDQERHDVIVITIIKTKVVVDHGQNQNRVVLHPPHLVLDHILVHTLILVHDHVLVMYLLLVHHYQYLILFN
jgi:hypothetical protein